MKKLSPLFLALSSCFLPFASQAQSLDSAASPAFSASATTEFQSSYMFRGQLLDNSSLQPSIEIDYNNLVLGIWTDTSTNKLFNQVEIDPYASYNINLNDNLSIVPGFTIYSYTKVAKDEYKETFEPSLSINYSIRKVKFVPEIFYDIILHSVTEQIVINYGTPLSFINSELDFSAAAGHYNIGQIDRERDEQFGYFWSLGFTVPCKITDKVNLTLGYSFNKGEMGYEKDGKGKKYLNDNSVGRGVVSASLSYSF